MNAPMQLFKVNPKDENGLRTLSFKAAVSMDDNVPTKSLLPPKLQRRGLVFKGKMVTMKRV